MTILTFLASAYVVGRGTPIGSMALSPTQIIAEPKWPSAAGGSRGVSGRDEVLPVSEDNPVLEHLELEGREPEVLSETVRRGAESLVSTAGCWAKASEVDSASKEGDSSTTAGGEFRAENSDARVGVTGGVANTMGSSSEDMDISTPSRSILSAGGG